MKSVVLHIHDDDALDERLQVALDVCRAMEGHLSCVHVTPYSAFIAFDPMGGVASQGAVLDELRERETETRKRVEQILANEDIPYDWKSRDGDVAGALIASSELADLIVVSQYTGSSGGGFGALPIVDDVVIHASCAVLVVPKGVSRIDCAADVVVGWNASAEAAHAIRKAVPLLRLAKQVHLASVGEDDRDFPQMEANAYLSRHGITSDLHVLPGAAKNAPTILHDFAQSKAAGCIVMGAYGRSRLRETLLGGATKDLLSSSRIPLLLAR